MNTIDHAVHHMQTWFRAMYSELTVPVQLHRKQGTVNHGYLHMQNLINTTFNAPLCMAVEAVRAAIGENAEL